MSQQNPVTDREVGIPGIWHGERFADMRARSKSFDEARIRAQRRKKKPRDLVTYEDFHLDDVVEVVLVLGNGHRTPGKAIVIDTHCIKGMGYSWRRTGSVYVRWISEEPEELRGHVFPLNFEPDCGYLYRGSLKWVP